MAVYNAAWYAATPFLSLVKRLKPGFRERLVPHGWPGAGKRPTVWPNVWQDVWLHAASGGEAYLAWEILKHFPDLRDHDRAAAPTTLLATSWTEQGVGVLDQAMVWCAVYRPEIAPRRAYVPFDAPTLMRKALRAAMPKVVVLLETELWPGLLWACKVEDVPVLVVNGRLSRKSLAGYLALGRFFREVAPQRILAVSELDARRFATLFGADRVSVMPNIKFDRIATEEQTAPPDLQRLLDPAAPFVVLGSIRSEEEPALQELLPALLAARPDCCVGVFPKHLHRVAAWSKFLDEAGIQWTRRTQLKSPAAAGSVVLWDVFGELGQAYGLGQAAFVGGSLRPLGGQNFLEPLAHGLIPCIGPYWENFAWVGTEIVDRGLVRVVPNATALLPALLDSLERPASRQEVASRFSAYIAPRRGGTKMACEAIAAYCARNLRLISESALGQDRHVVWKP